MTLDPELQEILRRRAAELARGDRRVAESYPAWWWHTLENLLLEGVRIGADRARHQALWDPDLTPVGPQESQTISVVEPATAPGFKRKRRR